MKHFILSFLYSLIFSVLASAQTIVPFLTLPEGNTTGDGTFLGVTNYSTQPTNVKSFALEHHFYGTVNNSINFYRGGSVTGGFMTFNTNSNIERMRIDPVGNVGIGTISPTQELDVAGSTIIGNNYVNSNSTKLFLRNASGKTWAISSGANMIDENIFSIYDWTDNSTNPLLQINSNGNVGIGTTHPAYSLDVLGIIHAKEVLVDLNGVPDFVFDKDYKLPSIEHVASYVQENKHLPDIPSAKEIEKNGVSLNEMQVKLLQKVEELTLYAIQQNKKIEAMEKRIKELEAK